MPPAFAHGDQDRFAEWPAHFHRFSSSVPSFTHLLFCSGEMIVAELYRIRKLFLHDGLPCAWSGNAIENMSAASPLRKGWVKRTLGYCLILFQIRYTLKRQQALRYGHAATLSALPEMCPAKRFSAMWKSKKLIEERRQRHGKKISQQKCVRPGAAAPM